MAEFKPTASQQAAIEKTGRAILVSAGAGSGKTKVLTERLLARISLDADIDSFLIITFTKAAAAELRGRITEEISERLSAAPDNKRLRRQNALVQSSHIGTIHSFCASLLRENCHAAGLSPEFSVIDEDRSEAIRRRVIERVLDEAYEKADPDFLLLSDTFGRGRNDSRLTELVLSLHKRLQSQPKPIEWANKTAKSLYVRGTDAAGTEWGRYVLDYCRGICLFWADRFEILSEMCEYEQRVYDCYGEKLCEASRILRDFAAKSENDWDAALGMLPLQLPDFRGIRKTDDPDRLEYIKTARKPGYEKIKELQKLIFLPSSEIIERLSRTAPAVCALAKLIEDFDKAYSQEKRRRSELDFSDLEHMCLELLTDNEGKPTTFAKGLSKRYTEIMVDEYQDVNAVQDAIFRAISKDGTNLFMVGDVKQSIYRFRLADPTIFTEKYNSYKDLEKAKGNEPVRIMLRENFRSRREIINAANHIFGTLMSEKLGDISYDDKARLCHGAVYYEGSVPKPELVLVGVEAEEDGEKPENAALEALAVADKISYLMRNNTLVTDKGSMRPLRYGDIAILMRSANTAGTVFSRVLTERGIPVISTQTDSFFAQPEISVLRCFLAIIDNPHQDIPLISVLRSPVFGFTADELSEIRSTDRDSDFYTALNKSAEESEKCRAFLDKLGALREASHDLELLEFISHLYNETDYPALCSAMSEGAIRCKRLNGFTELAKRFESTGYRSLHRFIDWLELIAEKGVSPAGSDSGDAVRIMTVHGSKGLEFPVVFLCNTAKRFNFSDTMGSILMHQKLGFGPKLIDIDRGIEYPTIAHTAISRCLRAETLSEEMRLLYVALTRAGERLFMTAALKDPEKKLQEMRAGLMFPLAPEVLMGSSSISQWLMYAYLADEEHRLLDMDFVYPMRNPSDFKPESSPEEAASDPAAVEALREKLSFVYPHADAQSLPSKITATELRRYDTEDSEAMSIAPKAVRSFRLPDFARDKKSVSGAERGIATHTLLQYIDYNKAQTLDGIKEEVARLKSMKLLSERQADAVEIMSVRSLFASPLGRRIINADSIMREFRFSVLCPAEKLLSRGEGEKILLQGVIDCCIEENGELTLIDYKTDRVRDEALRERAEQYYRQLSAYRLAIESIRGKKVRECVLYFLHAAEAVIIDMDKE